MDAKMVRFLYACGIPFNVFCFPYWRDMVHTINKSPQGYKSHGYEKSRTVLLDRERAKIKRALPHFTDEWEDSGVSIVFDGWTNIRNKNLINVLVFQLLVQCFLQHMTPHQSFHLLKIFQNSP